VLPIVQSGATKQVSVANLTAGRDIAATSLTTAAVQAASSAGGTLKNNSGTAQMRWGSGGGSNLSLEVATNINPANAAVSISPTGTGTVAISPAGALTINPTTVSTINNTSIGATTASTGRFTSVTATTGNFVVGTSGQGIDFSATPGTGTSELLADYEEGIFSPTISSGITGVGYATQNGSYTKVGRLVTFSLRLELNAGTAAAAIVRIGGLPFTADATYRGYAGSWGYAAGNIIGSTTTNLPTLNIDAGATTIAFYDTAGSAFNGTSLVTASSFSVDLAGSYYTT
jgi:hypothetical protein